MFLTGKTAVVTGSTSGIGLACARALAGEGAAVVPNGFGEAEAIEAIRAELAALSGAAAIYDAADMTRRDDIAALVERAVAETGSCDIVVNNAGIQHVAGIADFPIDQYDRIIAINMSSAWHMMRAAVPHMRAKGWGRIVTTASAHSLVASPNKSAYVMAKHGVIGLTKSAALDVAAHGIRINVVCPGCIETPMGAEIEPAAWDAFVKMQPIGRAGRADEVAQAVLWLCSPGASLVLGVALPIDGGFVV